MCWYYTGKYGCGCVDTLLHTPIVTKDSTGKVISRSKEEIVFKRCKKYIDEENFYCPDTRPWIEDMTHFKCKNCKTAQRLLREGGYGMYEEYLFRLDQARIEGMDVNSNIKRWLLHMVEHPAEVQAAWDQELQKRRFLQNPFPSQSDLLQIITKLRGEELELVPREITGSSAGTDTCPEALEAKCAPGCLAASWWDQEHPYWKDIQSYEMFQGTLPFSYEDNFYQQITNRTANTFVVPSLYTNFTG